MRILKILIAILLLSISNVFAADPLVAFKQDNVWHFLANDGSTLFKSSDVLDVFGYSEGLFLTKVKKDGEITWAYLNTKGEVQFYNDSDDASTFVQGYAIVADLVNKEQNTKKLGYINTKGKLVVPKIYNDALSFSEGFAYVMNDTIRGYLNRDLKMQIKLRNNLVGFEFSEGIASVTSTDFKVAYIDTTGNLVLPFLYDVPSYCKEGTIKLCSMGKFGFMDRKGKPIVSAIYGETGLFKYGVAFVAKYDKTYNISWSLVNLKNELLTEFIYQGKHDFSDSLACVKFAGKWGYINLKTDFAFNANFDRAEDFINGLAWASINNDKCGFINKFGEFKLVMPKAEKYFEFRINKNVN